MRVLWLVMIKDQKKAGHVMMNLKKHLIHCDANTSLPPPLRRSGSTR